MSIFSKKKTGPATVATGEAGAWLLVDRVTRQGRRAGLDLRGNVAVGRLVLVISFSASGAGRLKTRWPLDTEFGADSFAEYMLNRVKAHMQ